MSNLSMFCLTLKPEHKDTIKQLSYIPVGLGDESFPDSFLNDKSGINIAEKNMFYGEYTFHYWLWKNYLDKIKTKWVGFCQYRKFFAKEEVKKKDISFEDLKNSIINNINEKKNFDCILGSKFFVNNYKFSKIVKNHFFDFIKKPELFFNKKKRTLNFHFDLFHGKGNLDSAIKLLDQDHRDDFKAYMYNNISFNPHNMFICKTVILENYYAVIFPWLKKCENIFGFKNLDSYGQKRIYGFLAERFLSYWLTKNFKVEEHQIFGKDLSDYKYL